MDDIGGALFLAIFADESLDSGHQLVGRWLADPLCAVALLLRRTTNRWLACVTPL